MYRARFVALSRPLLHSQRRSVNVFAEFAKSVKRQIDENKDFQQNIKSIGDEKTRIADSDAMQRAKAAMAKGSETTGKVMGHVKSAASTVSDAVADTQAMKSTVAGVSYVATKTIETAQAIADPILDTEAAKRMQKGVKTMKREINANSTTARYSEYKPKAERDAERLETEENALKQDPLSQKKIGPMSANPDAGESVVVHQKALSPILPTDKQTAWETKWSAYKESSHLFRGISSLKTSINESDNPTIERMRDFFARFGEETEQAQVIRIFKQADPSFSIEGFMKVATQSYIPEIMEAYLKGDTATLKTWCSEPLCAQFGAGIQAQQVAGLVSFCRILDIRKVELVSTKLVESEVPMLFVDFNTQEILLFKNKKGEVMLGREDRIEHVRYRAVFTKDQCIDPTIPVNPETRGYRCMECIRIDSWEGF